MGTENLRNNDKYNFYVFNVRFIVTEGSCSETKIVSATDVRAGVLGVLCAFSCKELSAKIAA